MLTMNQEDFTRSLEDTLEKIRRILRKGQTNGLKVQSHPVGFMRVPLALKQDRFAPGYYIHIWDPGRFPSQQLAHRGHDHVYDVKSRVLLLNGTFKNVFYSVEPDARGSFKKTHAICKETTNEPTAEWEPVTVREISTQSLSPGDCYTIKKRMYHDTHVAGKAVTFVYRDNFGNEHENPYIISDSEPVQEVMSNYQIPQDEAWEMVWEYLG